MRTRFVANTPDEVLRVFGSAFLNESQPQSQPELDEPVQLSKFLTTAALTGFCRCPVEVDVLPRNHKPDFRVNFDGAVIGIEASKIANPDLEQVRSHQTKYRLPTMEISSLLAEKPQTSLKQKLNDCLARPAFIFPNPNQMRQEDEFWLKQARRTILRKHELRKKPDFNHYGESWLLLWDKLSSSEDELIRRTERLADLLVRFWRPDWFRKIIIQENHSDRFVILSTDGMVQMHYPKRFPVTEFVLSPSDSLLLE